MTAAIPVNNEAPHYHIDPNTRSTPPPHLNLQFRGKCLQKYVELCVQLPVDLHFPG